VFGELQHRLASPFNPIKATRFWLATKRNRGTISSFHARRISLGVGGEELRSNMDCATRFLRTFCFLSCASIAAIVLFASRTSAIEINVTYDGLRSQAPEFDINGDRLRGLVNAAAAYYEDIIEDEATIDLAFTWGELDSGTLGLAATVELQGGRPVSSRIRFNTNVDWFIDPTPHDHSEFNFIQTTVGDLSDGNTLNSLTGAPPSLLEVGFAGTRNEPDDTTDLYSVVLHELGHAVGLSSSVIGTAADDGDFDIPSRFLGGATAGFRVSSSDDVAHLAAPRTSMYPVIIEDIRRLPGATDILAIASAANWSEIDLPRKEFISGDKWNESGNWVGDHLPDADDDVNLRLGGEVIIDSAAVADSVHVAANTSLVISGSLTTNELTIAGGEHRLELSDTFVGIDVTNSAVIAGSLSLEAMGDLLPGTSFSLLSANEIVGAFSVADATPLDNSLALVFDASPNSLVATVAMQGDANVDGVINFADFLTVTQNFGQEGTWRRGDFNGDQTINFNDFLDVSQRFGAVAAQLSGFSNPVPEPSTVCLMLIAVAGLCMNRRCRSL